MSVFPLLVIVHALAATVWTGGHLVLDLGVLPSGLISDTGDGAIFSGARNKSVSNASGNLLVPDSGTDPFAAPLATLL